MLNATKTVKDIAIEVPGATRLFEKLGIDYCCGGGKTLSDACAASGLTLEEVTTSLARISASPLAGEDASRFQRMSLTELINHILETHHVFTRDELNRIEALLAKVCAVHGQNHPELGRLAQLFRDLKNDLEPHMFKEEMVLFPYVIALDRAAQAGEPAPPPPFGTVRNPIRMMMLEHDTAGDLLRELRRVASDYAVPPGVCISYETLYGALQGLERDLHQHIHLENNLLFPRAVELELSRERE